MLQSKLRVLVFLVFATPSVSGLMGQTAASSPVPHVNGKAKSNPDALTLTGAELMAPGIVGAKFLPRGKVNWDTGVVIDTAISKSKFETRMVQTVVGEARRIYKDSSAHGGKTGTKYTISAVKVDNPADIPSSGGDDTHFDFIGNDQPGIPTNASIFKTVEVDFTFKDYIQVRFDGGPWRTILVGSWKWSGDATALYNSSGIMIDATGAAFSHTLSDFVPSQEDPGTTEVKPDITNDANWTEY